MPPASGVTPAILVLNAIITALAAVLAVLVAQWWTNRREDRQWQRQRERDAEEREEQRRRDHALWEREDRHRFAEYKRELYAEYFSAVEEWVILIATAGPDSDKLPDDANDRLFKSLSKLTLVAPTEIEREARELSMLVWKAAEEAQLNSPEIGRSLSNIQMQHDPLRAPMRADLEGRLDRTQVPGD